MRQSKVQTPLTPEKIHMLDLFEHRVINVMAVIFIFVGILKFTGDPVLAENFIRWGYPAWFIYLVGASEVVGALMLFAERTSFYGAVILTLVMTGAVITHLFHGEILAASAPIPLLAIFGLIAIERSEPVVNLFAWLSKRGPGGWEEKLQ